MDIGPGVSSYNQQQRYGSNLSGGLPASENAGNPYQQGGSSYASGDSIISQAPRPRKVQKDDSAERKARIKRLERLKLFFAFVSVTFLILFFLTAAQPLLVTLFTIGKVVSDNFQDWLDFSLLILELSLIPGAIALLAGCGYLFSSRFASSLRKQEKWVKK